jgi:hypothetical protein
MEYDCTKPLGEHLEEYMDSDLAKICFELALHGIVYESQFRTLGSMVCKQNATALSNLFTEKTRRRIWYAYDKGTCNFVFYDMDTYKADEAIRLSEDYQTKRAN